MSVTGADIGYVSYRIAGILLEAGRGYSGSEGSDALRVLNSMLDEFQSERLMVYAYLRSIFEIIPGQEEYSVGTTTVDSVPPDWFLPRPEELTLAGYIFSNVTPNVENPMRILSYQEWAALSPKDLENPVQYMLYYEPTVPNGIVHLWPVPTDQSVTVSLYTWQNVKQIASLETAMELPPAYQSLLEYGLAIRLSGMFPRRAKLDPSAHEMFFRARMKVFGANVPQLKMQTEAAAGGVRGSHGRWNILSGTYTGIGSNGT